jgi:hypothetical protein
MFSSRLECAGAESRRLISAILDHAELQGLRRWALRTRDAHALYRRFGFVDLAEPQRSMERHNPDVPVARPQIALQGELK